MPTSSNVLQVVINGKNNAGPAFKQATQMMLRFGAVSTAALTAAAVRAGQFEKGMAEISTLLDGDVTPAIKDMREEVLQLSVDFGQTIGKLTKARYDIISAGFTDAADSAIILAEANRLAVAGVSDVAKTADLLTTAINGLGLTAKDTNRVSDVLFQTVRKGKTTISELAASFGPVFANARVANVSLEELGAVMATVTAAGIQTREASTALARLLLALAAPADEAGEALDDIGISLDKGLIRAMQDLASVSEEGLQALSQLFPNIRALKAAAVAAADIEKLNANMKAMAESSGVTEEAFQKMAETFDFQSKQARAALDALVITVGTEVLPVFTSMVSKVTEVAVLIRFLASENEDGVTKWSEYSDAVLEAIPGLLTAISVLDTLGGKLKGIGKFLGIGLTDFERRVREEIVLLEREASKDKSSPFHINVRFGKDAIDTVAIREYAELLVRAQGFTEAVGDGEDTFFGAVANAARNATDEIRGVIAEMQAAFEAAKRARIPAGEIIQTGFGAGEDGAIGTPARSVVPKKKETEDNIADLREQVASLAKFTAEDFANMAFTIGDSFAMVATDVGASLLGLTKGPIMLGRAFKSMAAGILGDIARIIARLLVARALMAAFGGGGFLGSVFGKLAGGSTGMTIPNAATGLGVAGSGMSMVLPGSPGLDRSLVLAHGGEVMVPRREVDAIDRSRKNALTAPPPARRSARRSQQGNTFQVIRPFRREEQNLLNDSVTEAEDRASRHRG